MGKNIYFVGNMPSICNDIKCCSIEDVYDYCIEQEILAVDTETSGVDFNCEKVIMFQIGTEDKQFVIDTRYVSIELLRGVLESDTITKILQNGKFDYKFILSSFNIRMRNIYDTMLAECLIMCGKVKPGYGLAKLAERHLGIELKKDVRSQFSTIDGGAFTLSQIEYGALDVVYLQAIREKQLVLIEQLELGEVLKLECDAMLGFAEIEYNGIKLDVQEWTDLASEAASSSKDLEKQLDQQVLEDPRLESFKLPGIQLDMFGAEPKETSVLWSSPTQVGKVITKLDPTIEDTSMRSLYKRQNAYPLIKTIIDYRKKYKLVTTYGLDFLKHVNKHSGRVHTMFWQILNTGRVSSGQTRSKNSPSQAPNMQNIPADIRYRNAFKAEPGWKIITMDYSGQELRLIAQGSKDPVWLQAFANGEDVHGKVAALVFDVDISQAKDKPDFLRGKSYRDVAKTINFGLAYGMSEYKLADTLGTTPEEAKKFIDKYFEALPGIKNFLRKLGDYGKKNGYIRTFKPFRRIRWFEDWDKLDTYAKRDRSIRLGEIERASKNTPIQGTGADMIKLSLSLMYEHIRDCNLFDRVRLITQVHDEIGCEVREDYVSQWVEIQRTIMELAGRRICKDVDMVVEHTVTDEWTK
jgi:DNA polymerase I-like protein with 3'-5' exonuclease and polymerase domains